MTRSARLPAYAKLNLGLRVLYKRPDGFHELRTVFQTISLADRLDVTYTPARNTRIEIAGTPEIPDNLVGKAARAVLEALRVHADVRFQLKKRIPAGAGLGGGSSDAAAVLIALPVLAGKILPSEKLHAIATGLGSDVPFFLHGGTALGLGRGEELYPLPCQQVRHALLIAPHLHSSTAEAYQDLARRLTSIPLQNKLSSFQRDLWQEAPGTAENDFEPVVFARFPELKQIKARLVRLGAKPAALTGSGSALFGVFSTAAQLDRAYKLFSEKLTSRTVFPVSFLSRAQYHSAWKRALRLHIKEDNLWPPRSAHAP